MAEIAFCMVVVHTALCVYSLFKIQLIIFEGGFRHDTRSRKNSSRLKSLSSSAARFLHADFRRSRVSVVTLIVVRFEFIVVYYNIHCV